MSFFKWAINNYIITLAIYKSKVKDFAKALFNI